MGVVPNQVLRSSWSKSPSTTSCSSTSSLSGGAQPSTKIFLDGHHLLKKMLMNRMLLMATCSKKILVLGWAPPVEEDVDEQDVVDGDLLQEDLSTWMGTTCSSPPPHNPCCTLSRATAWLHLKAGP